MTAKLNCNEIIAHESNDDGTRLKRLKCKLNLRRNELEVM